MRYLITMHMAGLLCSFFFFCLTILLGREEPFPQRIRFLFSRGIVIAGVTILLCGWWFIRNAVLYNGDFLGRRSCAECAEKYAQKDYRPSLYPTPEKLKWSWKDIIFYQDPGWYHNWALTVCVSFIGTFWADGDLYAICCEQNVHCIFCSLEY